MKWRSLMECIMLKQRRNRYGSIKRQVRLLDMSAMAYITRIKKTFLKDAMRSSNFIKLIIMEILTKVTDKYLKEAVADWDKKKVLTLTVSKEWFDMILSGEKTEEYREIKPYWVARLFRNNSNIVDVRHLALGLAGRTDLLKKYIDTQRIVLKQYTHVLFINGKPKKGLCPDKWLDTEFFIIKFK